MALRDTIDHLVGEARATLDDPRPTPEVLDGWQLALGQLYRQVEAYLIDDLLRGRLRLQSRAERHYAPGLGPVEVPLLEIAVGRKVVQLRPRLDLAAGRIGTVSLVGEGADAPEVVFPFMDTGASFVWCARAPERGLRRWLLGVLPDRWVPLDEALFKAALDLVLIGPQPLLTYDPAVVRERLGVVLDHLTAAELDVRLARLTREDVLPGLRRRKATVASTLKASATGVLSRVQGPRGLLLAHHPEGGAGVGRDGGGERPDANPAAAPGVPERGITPAD